jgi:hypothetical protein
MADLTDKVIAEDVATLRQAYQLRQREYDALRTAGEWAGLIVHGGMLLELALKIVICKNMGVTNLPKTLQVHDLKLLLYCSGLKNAFLNNAKLYQNFRDIATNWSVELRYKGTVVTAQDADVFHQALFHSSDGVLTFLSSFL